MAHNKTGADAWSSDRLSSHDDSDRKPEKRHSSDASGDSSQPKKISMSLGSSKPAPLLGQKISFNLSTSGDPKPKTISSSNPMSKPMINTVPIKMSLNTAPKVKEPPPIVKKSKAVANVFDESDESDEEEMPPEAKMRMKNVGRETPTASGPNSYGKGKMGFIDRQKIYEKQLKEDMEKVSGDNKNK